MPKISIICILCLHQPKIFCHCQQDKRALGGANADDVHKEQHVPKTKSATANNLVFCIFISGSFYIYFWGVIKISIWGFQKILILIFISIRAFSEKNPFFSAESRAFSCFYEEISISIVDISTFFEISMKYQHFFWKYQYRQNIDKKIFNISRRKFWKYRYRYWYP